MIEASQRDSLLAAAQEARRRGYRVIPLHRAAGTLKACSCRAGQNCSSAGKHPIEARWQKTDVMSAADVQAIWDVERTPNLGIATGDASGLFVLDIDPDNG